MTGHSSARLLRWGVPLAAVAVLVAFGVSSLASATGSSGQASKAGVRKTVTIRGNNRPHFVGAEVDQHRRQAAGHQQDEPAEDRPPHLLADRVLGDPADPPRQADRRLLPQRTYLPQDRPLAWFDGRTRSPAIRSGWATRAGTKRATSTAGATPTSPATRSSFQQRVSADNGVVLRFMCAVHPEMRKRIVVH